MSTKRLFSFEQDLISKHGLSIGRRLALLQAFLFISLAVTTLFFILDLIKATGVPRGVYIFIFATCFINLLLVVRGYTKLASIILFSFLNLVAYAITSSETMHTGFHLHTIAIGFGAMILFGYEEKVLGIFFAFVSFIVYVTSFTVDYSPLAFRNYSDKWVVTFFWINALLFIATVLYLFRMMMNLNYRAEKSLAESNQKSLLRNQQLSKTNEELDRFVFSTSNDLRAPLNSISGLINLAQTDSSGQQDYLRMIKGQIAVMEGFIKEIIDYSRNARLQVDNSIIPVSNLVTEVVSSLSLVNGFDKVKFKIELEEDLMVSSDAARLKIVFSSLIVNSIQYADFSKEESFIKILSSQDKECVQITIEDNGIGIGIEQQPRVFEMFYRGSDRSKGSGLGLYIAKETLAKLSGEISFESNVDKGTRFTLKLPHHVGSIIKANLA
jgi:signal transduction histidine kinase